MQEKKGTVDCILNRLANFETVTLELWSDSTLLLDACALFDDIADKYFRLMHRLNDRATFAEYSNFKQAILEA